MNQLCETCGSEKLPYQTYTNAAGVKKLYYRCRPCHDAKYKKPPKPRVIRDWCPTEVWSKQQWHKSIPGKVGGGHPMQQYQIDFFYDLYKKRHTRINKEFTHLYEKGLDFNNEDATIKCIEEIEMYRNKNELSKTV